MINIDNKFDIGELVYLKTDSEQTPRLVYAIEINQQNLIYKVASGTITSAHFDFELSTEVNVLLNVS